MTRRERIMLALPDEACLLGEEYDDALVGTADLWLPERGQVRVACYDGNRIVDILAREMSGDDAMEFAEFNIMGAYMGEGTPVFVWLEEDSAD